MSPALIELTERLVPISEFSQGKAGKIFNDVSKNNKEYIVMKNNQPTAVVISIQEYRKLQEKISKFEQVLEKVEEMRLMRLSEQRANNPSIPFEDLVKELGLSMEELEELAEGVEIE